MHNSPGQKKIVCKVSPKKAQSSALAEIRKDVGQGLGYLVSLGTFQIVPNARIPAKGVLAGEQVEAKPLQRVTDHLPFLLESVETHILGRRPCLLGIWASASLSFACHPQTNILTQI